MNELIGWSNQAESRGSSCDCDVNLTVHLSPPQKPRNRQDGIPEVLEPVKLSIEVEIQLLYHRFLSWSRSLRLRRCEPCLVINLVSQIYLINLDLSSTENV